MAVMPTFIGSSTKSNSANGYPSNAAQSLPKTPDEDGMRRQRSSFAIAAGWMIVLAGLLTFFNGFTAVMGETSWERLDIVVDLNRYGLCGAIVMVFGVLAIAGGISALRGKNISLALAGAALGMMGGGIGGFWLGITAILFIFLSSDDF